MNRASFLGVVLMMCGGSAQGPTPALAPSLARIAAPDVAASTADLPAPPRALPVSASRGSTPPLASAPAEVTFGTPSSADRFAALSSEPLPDSITYDADAIDYSATIEDGEVVDMSVRYYAPGQVPGGPPTTFNASRFHKLRLQLASVTDAVLTIKLVSSDSVVAEDCAATTSVLVDSNTTELELDLDASTFSLSEHCAAGTDVAALKAAIAAIDIVNPSTAAGAHNFRVGVARFGD
jgi:hypothetical protein